MHAKERVITRPGDDGCDGEGKGDERIGAHDGGNVGGGANLECAEGALGELNGAAGMSYGRNESLPSFGSISEDTKFCCPPPRVWWCGRCKNY